MEDDSAYHIAIVRVDATSVDEPIADATLQDGIRAALRRHYIPRASVNVALVGDDRISELNQRHLDHEGPTDVLTFDLRDDDEVDGDGHPSPGGGIEGDIVISIETAAREAKSRGHAIEAELSLYAVHGVLHLLGYDDQEEGDAAKMHAEEDDILKSLGIGPVYEARQS